MMRCFVSLSKEESTKPIDKVVWEILWHRVKQAALDEVKATLTSYSGVHG